MKIDNYDDELYNKLVEKVKEIYPENLVKDFVQQVHAMRHRIIFRTRYVNRYINGVNEMFLKEEYTIESVVDYFYDEGILPFINGMQNEKLFVHTFNEQHCPRDILDLELSAKDTHIKYLSDLCNETEKMEDVRDIKSKAKIYCLYIYNFLENFYNQKTAIADRAYFPFRSKNNPGITVSENNMYDLLGIEPLNEGGCALKELLHINGFNHDFIRLFRCNISGAFYFHITDLESLTELSSKIKQVILTNENDQKC